MIAEEKHKAGFVNILGNPNVGKSTLMNALTGEKLSAITSKAQTTRHRILGIINGDDFQIVYSDTPGIIKPSYRLQDSMLSAVNTAFSDADVILYVTDVVESFDKNKKYIEKLRKTDIPVIVLINKIDIDQEDKNSELKNIWKEILPDAEVYSVSALQKTNLDHLFQTILDKIPFHPPYYPKDELTDRPQRFFVAEIIREKIFLNYQKEIPYSTEVVIESYKEEKDIDRIHATIFVAKKSHKGIIIGAKGEAIKKTGTEARKDIEAFIDKKVFLELYVKVAKDWKNKDNMLKQFGYR